MLERLLPCATRLVVTSPPTPRAADGHELATLARTLRPDLAVEVEPDPVDALEAAWRHAPDICVAGSIFLLGAVLPWLDRHAPAHAR